MIAKDEYTLKPKTSGLFAWSNWDLISVLAAFAHLAFVIWAIADFDNRPMWVNVLVGLAYAIGISWNINGVSHNFLHTPFFRSKPLNYAFSLLESVTIGFSQTYYTYVHNRHHEGNSDRPDAEGKTRDWLSIYKYGKNGQPENVWSYVFLSFFRDGPDIHQALKDQRRSFDANWGRVEIAAFVLFIIGMLFINWHSVLMLVPFYYLGECFSHLNGYYEHLYGDPDTPMNWGVSTYAPIYNLTWFNNGHHAEHHFRPKVHWTKLPALRRAIAQKRAETGGHDIETAHAFGFLAKANRKPKPD